ncbi:hypothetical protein THAOC_14943 [Thalassiosira oceanica]|uniref:Uncharacterized protein n=1 Tax=Thalassiosira oceanica TaxID=159749 RepID=K0SG62_THAOC|nr:hypothetical protein THAOC_14943 [Thalassiosira oceanica]|eukprot:EJK64335.1 hypothetical protein THAOC_14943 [Thalassiosira oceanica]
MILEHCTARLVTSRPTNDLPFKFNVRALSRDRNNNLVQQALKFSSVQVRWKRTLNAYARRDSLLTCSNLIQFGNGFVVFDRSEHHKVTKSGYDGLFFQSIRAADPKERDALFKSIGGKGCTQGIISNTVLPWLDNNNGREDWPWLMRTTVFEEKPDFKEFAQKRAEMLSKFINTQPATNYRVQFYVSWEEEASALNEYLQDDDVAMLLKYVFADSSKDTLCDCDELMVQAYGDADLGKYKLQSMDDEVRMH